MDKLTFQIKHDNPQWRAVRDRAINALITATDANSEVMVAISDVVRSLDQNAAMWPALTDICRQVPLVVFRKDGTTREATAYDWKDVLTAAFEEETEWTPGLRGGVVMLGARTSKYGKKKMRDFLTFVRAEGNERGVQWSEKAKDKFDEFGVYVSREAA